MLGDIYLTALKIVPLSTAVVSSEIEVTSLERELITLFKISQGFAVQADAYSDVTSISVLLAYVRYNNQQVEEEMRVCRHFCLLVLQEKIF